MSLEGHLNELSEKHKSLEKQITQEMARPSSDDVSIRRLKQEKLKIKEAIERIRSETRH
ncbi:MAG: DUF465 domain-containing protein [Pseudomonadota bacterium]